MKKNIIFFDVETNGKVGSAVLSISAIKVSYDFENDSWEKVSEYDRFYFRNEGESIDFGAINVNAPGILLPSKKDVYGNIEGLMNQFKLTFEGIKVPKGEYYSSTEAANGELGFFIVSDGSGRPYKVKCRPPCFYTLAAFSKIVEGGMLADAVVTMASLNFIAGEFDR